MIEYVDASVLLRVALRQRDALPEWRHIDQGVASALILTESLRTLDRLRLRASLSDDEVATRRATILRLIASLELVELDEVVLERAAQPMPTELGTLDALHLATAVYSGGKCRAPTLSWRRTTRRWGWRHGRTAFGSLALRARGRLSWLTSRPSNSVVPHQFEQHRIPPLTKPGRGSLIAPGSR